MKRICESLGFSEDYVGSLLDILSSIAQHEATIVEFAKGLEWEQVYLIDLVEGILPEWETIRAERELTLCSLKYLSS